MNFWYYGNNEPHILKKFKRINDFGITIWPYYQVNITDHTLDIILNEKFEIIKKLFRIIKIKKITNSELSFDDEFLIFYIENINNINLIKHN